ncbi:FABP family protein [Brevibacterium yomogidense]|uniref:FABP family protein n=1 Tax=Brevibacterium yomogidense TaxID=946573 RepID=UPI0018DF3261|nr:FABP family protein [Brevibacterium yomogidense]
MPVEIPVDLQPELVPLAWLIGTWEGHGAVVYTDVEEKHIFQRASFTTEGDAPYLLYTCRTWLTDDADPEAGGASGTLLGIETGFWQLARPRGDHDTGPGLLPPTAAYPYTTAAAVEELRTERGDFDIEVALSYPHGLMEHYAGRVAGPRVDLASDGGVKTPTALDYRASTRMYGLVDGHLMWVWEMAANGQDPAAHVSADLQRTTPSVLG